MAENPLLELRRMRQARQATPDEATETLDSYEPMGIEQDVGMRPAPPMDEEVSSVMQGWQGKLPTKKHVLGDGSVIDQYDFAATEQEVRKHLAKRHAEEIRIKGGIRALAPDELEQRKQSLDSESRRLTERWLSETGGSSHPVLDPGRALTKAQDDKDLAEKGLLPTGSGHLAGKARQAQELAIRATEGRDTFAPTQWWADTFFPGLIDEETGAVGQLPERVGPVPVRATMAMLYPYHGYEAGQGNILHKLAQDFIAPVLAVGETTQMLMEEDKDLTFLEARKQARTDPRTIEQVRSNLSTYEYAQNDKVPAVASVPWLAYRALTGKNIVEEIHGSVGIDLRDYPIMGTVFQGAKKLRRKHPLNPMKYIGRDEDELMTPQELDTEILGPLATAVLTPDLLVGGSGFVKTLRTGWKANKGAIYGAAMEKNAGAVDRLVARLEDAIEGGKSDEQIGQIIGEELSLLKKADLPFYNATIEKLRRVLSMSEKAAWSPSFSKQMEKLTKNSERSVDQLNDLVKQLRQHSPNLHVPTPTGAAPYKPLFLQPGLPPAQRITLAKTEAQVLQMRHALSSAYESVLAKQVQQLEKMGVLAKRGGSTAKAGEALASFRRAAAEVETAIRTGDDMEKVLVQYDQAYRRLISEGSAVADKAVYDLLLASRKAKVGTRAHLEAFYKQMSKSGMTDDAVDNFKVIFEAQLSKLTDEAAAAAPLASGARGELIATLRGMSQSARTAAGKLRKGEALSGQEVVAPFYEVQALPPQDVAGFLRRTFGDDAYQAMVDTSPSMEKVLAGQKLPAQEMSQLLRSFSQRAKVDPFSAWAMSTHAANVGGLRVRGKGAVFAATALLERSLGRLNLSGLLRDFKIGGEEMLNIGRHGVATMRIGADDLAKVQKAASDGGPEATILAMKRFLQDPAWKGASPYRAGSGASPIAEAVNAWRAMGRKEAVNHPSFKVVARAFLGKGEQAGGAWQSAPEQLAELVFADTKRVLSYDDLVKFGQSHFRDLRAPATDLRSHQALSMGVINASAMQRMFDAAAVKMAGFKPGNFGAAIETLHNKGKVSSRFAEEARAIMETMGIPPGVSRGITRDQSIVSSVVVRNSDDAMNAVIPRSYLEKLGEAVRLMEKAPDASKAKLGFLQKQGLSTAVERAVLLMRWGITTGLLLPRPSYYYKNLVGAIGQVGVTANVDSALTATLAAGSPIPSHIVRPLFSKMPRLDARLARYYKDMAARGGTGNVLPPPNIGMHNRFVRGMLDDADIPPGTLFQTSRGETLAKAELVEEMTRGGVFSTHARTFLMEDASRVVERGFRAQPGSLLDKGWDIIAANPQRFAGWMDTVENHQRIALYMDARLRKGLSAEASSRLVREAYFDWNYPFNLFGETAFMGLPIMMFGSMWKNAATHTIQALLDPKKTKRMMDMFKSIDIYSDYKSEPTGEGLPPEMVRFQQELPWWSGKSGQGIITRPATGEEAISGMAFHGGPTSAMATALPGILSHDMTVLMANTMVATAAFVNDIGRTPETKYNREAYFDQLGATMSTFMNPLTAGAIGVGEIYHSYDGKMKATPAEAAMFEFLGIGNPEISVNEDTGGMRYRANKWAVRGTRLMPGVNRIVRDADPLVRQQMGDPSVQLLRELAMIEMGSREYPVVGGAAEYIQRQKVLEGKAKDISK